MNSHSLKRLLARSLDSVGVTQLLSRSMAASTAPFIRAINYHGIPMECAANFEQHLQYFAEHYQPVGLRELTAFLNGEWKPCGKPGLIITFDDGLRSHCEIAAPLLERYGFPGWFFIPAALVDMPAYLHRAGAAEHQVMADTEAAGSRVFMSWDELRDLRSRHVIGCHTASHHRITKNSTAEQLEIEIAGAKRRFEEVLNEEMTIFCWVGGEESSYTRAGAEGICDAGFRMSFMTNHAVIRKGTCPHHLQRSNIEATDPLWLVRFQLSGIMDLLYTPKRRRVNTLTDVMLRRPNDSAPVSALPEVSPISQLARPPGWQRSGQK
jgi:peptidoglycan/xylan/chitin deacetylase (PgdA/CDA1 family)